MAGDFYCSFIDIRRVNSKARGICLVCFRCGSFYVIECFYAMPGPVFEGKVTARAGGMPCEMSAPSRGITPEPHIGSRSAPQFRTSASHRYARMRSSLSWARLLHACGSLFGTAAHRLCQCSQSKYHPQISRIQSANSRLFDSQWIPGTRFSFVHEWL